ncbi:MAG: oligosaccharide flippase family protein [Candidatus Limnocylindrales bacterium]
MAMPTVGRLHLPHGSIARNLAVVGGGTALGQGSIVLAAPLLARLYDPQAFGLLSIYTAVISVLLAVASFRFDLAIPTADDLDEAVHLLALSLLLAVVVSVALGLVVLVWGGQLATALGAAPLTPSLWLLPVALLVAGVAQALASMAVYQRSFSALGRMRASQGLAQVIGQAALGFIHAGPVGLLLGDVAGRTLGIEQLVSSLRGTLRSTSLSWRSMIRHGRRRWGFARVMTAASVLNMISLQIPFLLIPVLFDLDATGQFFLAYRVLVLPASLVAAAASQVFFGEASLRRADPRRLHELAHSVSVSLFVFSIPTYAIVMVCGQALIQTVFGPQWQQAGQLAQVLAPSLVLWAVASPISALLLIGRRERESLAFTAAELAVRAGALVIGAALHSLLLGIVILSAAGVLLGLASVWRFLRVAGVSLGQLVRPVARIAALTAPVAVLVGIVGATAPGVVPLAAGVGWAVAFGLAARFSPETRALLSGSHD